MLYSRFCPGTIESLGLSNESWWDQKIICSDLTCHQDGDGLQHDADDGWKKRPHQITVGALKIHEKKPSLCAFAIFAFTFPRFGPGSQEMEKCLDPKIEEASLLLG